MKDSVSDEELGLSGWEQLEWGTHRIWWGPYGSSYLVIRCFGPCQHTFGAWALEFQEEKEIAGRMFELFRKQVPSDCVKASKVLAVREVLQE